MFKPNVFGCLPSSGLKRQTAENVWFEHFNFLTFLALYIEYNRHRHIEKLSHANKDQINAVSEFTLNMLKKKIPLPPPIVAKLKKHKMGVTRSGQRQKLINETASVAC